MYWRSFSKPVSGDGCVVGEGVAAGATAVFELESAPPQAAKRTTDKRNVNRRLPAVMIMATQPFLPRAPAASDHECTILCIPCLHKRSRTSRLQWRVRKSRRAHYPRRRSGRRIDRELVAPDLLPG